MMASTWTPLQKVRLAIQFTQQLTQCCKSWQVVADVDFACKVTVKLLFPSEQAHKHAVVALEVDRQFAT